MNSKQKFDAAAKARITRAETAKHGQIPPGGFGSHVQSVVDRTTAKPPLVTKTARTKR